MQSKVGSRSNLAMSKMSQTVLPRESAVQVLTSMNRRMMITPLNLSDVQSIPVPMAQSGMVNSPSIRQIQDFRAIESIPNQPVSERSNLSTIRQYEVLTQASQISARFARPKEDLISSPYGAKSKVLSASKKSVGEFQKKLFKPPSTTFGTPKERKPLTTIVYDRNRTSFDYALNE